MNLCTDENVGVVLGSYEHGVTTSLPSLCVAFTHSCGVCRLAAEASTDQLSSWEGHLLFVTFWLVDQDIVLFQNEQK